MAPIDDAIAEIQSLAPREHFSYQKIADRHNVWRSTLSRRHRGVSASLDNKNWKQRKLNTHEEAEVVQYIQDLTNRHLPSTRNMIRNFACQIAKNYLFESWVTRFINRHKIQFISKRATGMDQCRHAADLAGKYKLYFDLV